MKNKGQTNIVGALIILSIFIVLISGVQLVIVPQEERIAEEEHFNSIEKDLPIIHQNIVQSASNGEESRTSINMGVEYEQGFIFDSPFKKIKSLEPSGNLKAIDRKKVELVPFGGTQLKIASSKKKHPNSYDLKETYETDSIEYSINYNRFGEIDRKVIEGQVYFEETDNGEILLSNQKIIQDNEITINLIESNISENSIRNLPLSIKPISSYNKGINVENLAEVRFPSSLSENNWKSLVGDKEHVVGVRKNAGVVTISLESGVTYNLKIGKVKVETVSNFNPIETPKGKYSLTTPKRFSFGKNKRNIQVTASIRDKYNNPVQAEKGEFLAKPNLQGNWELKKKQVTYGKYGKAENIWSINSSSSNKEFEFKFDCC